MRRLRVLVATVGAALAMALFPAPAHASHHCAYPEGDDPHGINHTLWVVCEYGVHDPVGVAGYVYCRLSRAC